MRTDIDINKIQPGDTVRVQIRTSAMRAAGVPAFETESIVYRSDYGSLQVADFWINSSVVTILSHTPGRPDWADALVVRDKSGFLWRPLGDGEWTTMKRHFVDRLNSVDLNRRFGPITVIINGDSEVVSW